MTNERDFKPAANPFAFMPGGSSYTLSTMSMNDTILVQADKAVVPVASVDDIIVQAVTAPDQTALDASHTPCSGKRHFYNGLLGSTAASALTCSVLFTGFDPAFAGCVLSLAGMTAVLTGGFFPSQSKSGVSVAAGVGLLTSVFGAGLGYPAAVGGLMLLSSVVGAATTVVGAAGMPPDMKKRGASGGFKLAAGTALGCLAGVLMSAFTSVASVESGSGVQNRSGWERVEVEVHTTQGVLGPMSRGPDVRRTEIDDETAPRLTEDGSEYIPQRIVPRETAPRLN